MWTMRGSKRGRRFTSKMRATASASEILADDTGIELLIARLEEADEDEPTWDA